MVSLLQIVVLALVQGLTEFLPISSSAHLALVPYVFNWPDQGLIFDVAVHFGTLLAVVLYFSRDVIQLTKGGFDWATFNPTRQRTAFLHLLVATIPVVIVGVAVGLLSENGFRLIEVIAWSSIVFGVLLYVADRFSVQTRTLADMTYGRALFIGLGQSMAIIPGTSRAGSTMTFLRLAGFNRTETAHFSCLMSIPTIIAASLLMGYKIYKMEDFTLYWDLFYAVSLSFVAGYASIAFMMRWVAQASYSIFVIYRVALGGLILVWLYWA